MSQLQRVRSVVFGVVLSVVMAVGLGLGSLVARADDAAEDRATSFEAVSGAVKEDVPGGPLLLAAYALIWLAVFGYVFRLVRLQRGVAENVARLQQDLTKATQRADTLK